MTQSVILLVEDNIMNLNMATFLLQRAGFQTLEAEDAVTGIRLAQEHQPDLILLDIHLPGLDGYDAARIIKANSDTAHINVVAFTAHAMEDELQKALACGCVGIISKPINVESFAQDVAQFLKT
jgi:CheY-like chemotaxis protein